MERIQMADKETDYKRGHLRITVKSMYELGIYSDEDGAIDFASILSSTQK